MAASFLSAAPAAAVQVVPPVTFLANTANWVVPVGVHSINVTAVGGAGGAGGGGVNGGAGGAGATVTSTIAVTPGETIDIYVGLAGGVGGGIFTPGAGGGGYATGGDGAYSGFLAYSGGGGGGSSAVQVDGDLAPVVIAGGGGGGGGRGGVVATCPGGAGGDGADAGENALAAGLCNSNQLGGAAGTDAMLAGVDAVGNSDPFIANGVLGGSGGGGAGDGKAGTLNENGIIDNSGGGGGGGGASLGGAVATGVPAGSGEVVFSYSIAYPTVITAVATPNPATSGQKITVTATVDNQEPGAPGNLDPAGLVDFGIPGCTAVPLVGGTAGDGLATAKCEYTAGAPSSITYDIDYNANLDSVFAFSSTTLKIDVVAALAATGVAASSLLPVGGAALVLLLGGALLVLRRRTA
jgi:LPXTG-motif cell wall-anchored protein